MVEYELVERKDIEIQPGKEGVKQHLVLYVLSSDEYQVVSSNPTMKHVIQALVPYPANGEIEYYVLYGSTTNFELERVARQNDLPVGVSHEVRVA